ncbi:MAG: sugar transferase [Oculatellaceae cyanobacterium Prado106]|jgi:hypothetical protein|nr:sugar transferase [Oculatellaceae cyanobacterium Prado106]
MTDGIYTLANDGVFDQLVALLNSIEANAGKDMPVCVIAYDQRLERTRAEIAQRPNVTLMDDETVFARWEAFSTQVWQTHAHALDTWKSQGIDGVYRLSCNHRYAAFDPEAPFDRFIYLDADTLVLDSLDLVFNHLDHHSFVTYDFQFQHPKHIFNLESPRLLEIFSQERINTEIFCSGFYASHRGQFPAEQRDWLVSKLAEGESDVLYLRAPNQSVLNYMTMRSQLSPHNLAIHLPADQRTGNSVTNSSFEFRADRHMYHNDRRMTYMHYIGLSSKLFKQISTGENIDFPYRDVFLHYRFLHTPNQKPTLTGKPKPYNAPPSLAKRVMRKLGLAS